MARMLVGDKEIPVAEEVDEIFTRISNAHQGVQRASIRVTPPGWIILHASDLGGDLYVQASRIGYIRKDA